MVGGGGGGVAGAWRPRCSRAPGSRPEGICDLGAHRLEAVEAVNRPRAGRHERDLRRLPAVGADDIVHLALRPPTVRRASGAAALGAAARLVHEPPGLVELLLAGCEDEFTAAVAAGQGLVVETHRGRASLI